jgi:hypothetical protein
MRQRGRRGHPQCLAAPFLNKQVLLRHLPRTPRSFQDRILLETAIRLRMAVSEAIESYIRFHLAISSLVYSGEICPAGWFLAPTSS